MSRTAEEVFPLERMEELAARAERTEKACFTPFLTPVEAENARIAAKRQCAALSLFGGYEDAERQMAQFAPDEEGLLDFPMAILEITWPRQSAPDHRALLGSVMALGVKRQCLGDIVLLEDKAYLFADQAMAQHLADSLTQAGRVNLKVQLAEEAPALQAPVGQAVHQTVASLRLDAVIASGLNMSREKAAALITSGHVKLRYMPTLRTDAKVEAGDRVSIRGMGRLQLLEVGQPTRKGRLPITLMRFGIR